MSSRNYTDSEDFAKNLQICMRERGLSQTSLSESTGISQAAISRYLKGLSTPGAKELCSMADAMQISMDYLWRGGEYTETHKCQAENSNKGQTPAEIELADLKRCLRVVFRAMSEPDA